MGLLDAKVAVITGAGSGMGKASVKVFVREGAKVVAADISGDGSLISVAGSDGLLHQLNTALAVDQNQISFSPLPNSSNNFCFTGSNCALNIVAVKP